MRKTVSPRIPHVVADSLIYVHQPASAPIAFALGDEDTALVLPPGAASDVCHWCHGVLRLGEGLCFNCEDNRRALDGTVEGVVPISLYAKPSLLRDWLTFYKDDGETPADPNARKAIGSVLGRFFAENADWVSSLRIDSVLIVPSTRRMPPHPLTVLLKEYSLLPVPVSHGLQRTTEELDHNRPNKGAFAASAELEGKRVLLIDDVYTSGARAQSAAFALRAGGAEVASLLVIGRRYNPGYSEQSAAIFARQSERPFDWSVEGRDPTRTSIV